MSFLRYIPVQLLLIIVVSAIVAVVLAAAPGVIARDFSRAIAGARRVLLLGSVAAILILTLVPTAHGSGVNLVPLRGIAGQMGNVNGVLGAVNVLGNTAMFVPAGFLAAMTLGWGARRVSVAGLVLSVAIELCQLALGRSADVDDLILNTTGAAIGAIVWLTFVRLQGRRIARQPAVRVPPTTTPAT